MPAPETPVRGVTWPQVVLTLGITFVFFAGGLLLLSGLMLRRVGFSGNDRIKRDPSR